MGHFDSRKFAQKKGEGGGEDFPFPKWFVHLSRILSGKLRSEIAP